MDGLSLNTLCSLSLNPGKNKTQTSYYDGRHEEEAKSGREAAPWAGRSARGHGRVQPPLWEPVALQGCSGTWRGAGVAFVLSLRHWEPPLSATPGCTSLAAAWAVQEQRETSQGCAGGVSLRPAQAPLAEIPGSLCRVTQPGCATRCAQQRCWHLLCLCFSNPIRGMEESCWTAEASFAGPSWVGS